ncbi:GNAT family N-acetyltransferase [Oleiagrimonas soli]|uniref:Acetyltransferase n=1 Tax=Oleiagrimonas soli TaxID=1543381 RepID=A0A099CVK9_9GAMM|nr:GNAT family N-acetyltransferase [Oleiagrimonas soli]KGI77978.1 acetyltransferase [Oleiagrimonas soli]MBB6183643.1 GNAT superfamily N-acetyltransferase [Oleiagrimonas soli]
MNVRGAIPDDAEAISDVLEELVAAGKRTKPGDAAFVLRHYIVDPDRVQCSVAVDDDGRILGLQSLKRAREGNSYGTPVGWGIIGTHVRPSAARKGVGRGLFAAIRDAAHAAGLERIEAYIGADNDVALDYYGALGFRVHRHEDGIVCKVYEVA